MDKKQREEFDKWLVEEAKECLNIYRELQVKRKAIALRAKAMREVEEKKLENLKPFNTTSRYEKQFDLCSILLDVWSDFEDCSVLEMENLIEKLEKI